jgi:serine/threonine protein kinase
VIIDEQELVKVKNKQTSLGTGAFGSVELFEYKGVRVAVKRIIPSVAKSRTDVESFLNECRILNEIKHPSIAAFIGSGFPLDLQIDCLQIDKAKLFAVQVKCAGFFYGTTL